MINSDDCSHNDNIEKFDKIQGLFYIDNIIEDTSLVITELDKLVWCPLTNSKNSRLVQHYGYKYNYTTYQINEKCSDLPHFLSKFTDILTKVCYNLGIIDINYKFNQCIVNNYYAGQGISPHIDVKENILIPLKMNNTGIQDCNITLYDAKIKKLTKFQKWERTFASSAGELKSCVHDLIKFTHFFKLLNKDSIEILKNLYIFKENIKNNTFKIEHNGLISGGASGLLIRFHKNFIIKNIYIKLETGVN